MPLRSLATELSPQLVGRTPRSAADALVGLFGLRRRLAAVCLVPSRDPRERFNGSL